MTRLGLPVPPGFTVTTAACNAYLEGGETFPEGLWEEVLEALARLETGDRQAFRRRRRTRSWSPAGRARGSRCPA
jgi:phosphoenolpyruvate synthase/pyruvate phosphate dikinase